MNSLGKVVVTGGAGFIGSHLVEALIPKSEEVVVLDNLSSGTLENIEHVRDKITFVEGCIINQKLVNKVCREASYVFHQAGVLSVMETIEDPQRSHDVNVNGTVNVFLAAREGGAKRVVYASSAALYGNSEEIPKKESMRPGPLSPYALHKLIAEQYGQLFGELYGLETVGLRYFNVFGERQRVQSGYGAVIPTFIDFVKAGKQPTIYGDGTRDYVSVKDVVTANILACTTPAIGGEVFNVASGKETATSEVFETIRKELDSSLTPQHAPARKGEVARSVADISHAKNVLGYTPHVSFGEGIHEILT